jgi:hypothetical protein
MVRRLEVRVLCGVTLLRQRASPDTSHREDGQVGTKAAPSGIIHGVSINAASAYTWHSDLPDGCPPPGVQAADGDFYRLVKNNPPLPADFLRPRDGNRMFGVDELCLASSHSIFGDMADARKAIEVVPGFRKRLIARGALLAHMGVTLATPASTGKSHTSWWVPVGIEPAGSFSVIQS